MNTGNSNFAHTIAGYVGVLYTIQGPITAYVSSLPIPVKVANLAVGAFTMFMVIWKAKIDSAHNIAMQGAAISPQAVVPAHVHIPADIVTTT